MRLRFFLCFAAIWCLACSNTTGVNGDASTTDTSSADADVLASDVRTLDADASVSDVRVSDGGFDAGDARRLFGFIVDGPHTQGPAPSGANYTLDAADAGSAPVGTIGSPCTSGSDCVGLGPHAACFRNATGGFCTIDCDLDPEGPSQLCPAGSYCFAGLRADGGRLCLTSCASNDDCGGNMASSQCSGSLFTFNLATGYSHVCLPSCATDADCNADVSGFVCDTTHHRCAKPRETLGSACMNNADCLGLGPNGLCMKSALDSSRSYCTLACDPSAADACTLGAAGTLGPCVSGYATALDGSNVPVCLGGCHSDAECQSASLNTCNYLPAFGVAACTIACSSDADCVDGTCNVATGDCRQGFYSPNCGSDSNCTGHLCVTDFHHPESHNCSTRCTQDVDCPAGAVCVISPVALDGAGTHIAPGTGSGDTGFCAPSCVLDAGTCADPTTQCLAPHDPPEIDFAGSGNASSAFCWR